MDCPSDMATASFDNVFLCCLKIATTFRTAHLIWELLLACENCNHSLTIKITLLIYLSSRRVTLSISHCEAIPPAKAQEHALIVRHRCQPFSYPPPPSLTQTPRFTIHHSDKYQYVSMDAG